MATSSDEKNGREPIIAATEIPEDDVCESNGSLNDPCTVKSWHGAAAAPELESWADEIEVRRTYKNHIKETAISIALMIFPALYIALAALVAALNGRPVEAGAVDLITRLKDVSLYWGITQATTVAVTAFPIAFGIVLAKTLKTAALYKAERGTNLITLEQLVASKSVGSAIMSPLNFKRLNKTAAILIALWFISPFTTQGLQRMFSVGTAVVSQVQQPIEYLNSVTVIPLAFSSTSSGPLFAQIQSLFNAALLQPQEEAAASPVDSFGNPKIPLLSEVSKHSVPDKDGWYTLNPGFLQSLKSLEGDLTSLSRLEDDVQKLMNSTGPVPFSSMYGLPIAGIRPNTSEYAAYSEFTVQASYWETINVEHHTLNSNQLAAKQWYSKELSFTNCPYPYGSSGNGSKVCELDDYNLSFFLTPIPNSNYTDTIGAIFGSHIPDYSQGVPVFSVSLVTWNRWTVDVNVLCAGRSCTVAQMRYAVDPPPLFTAETYHPNWMWSHFFQAFGIANQPLNILAGDSGVSSAFEYWLANPNSVISNHNNGVTNLSAVDTADLISRFSLAWNTFFQLGIAPSLYLGGLVSSFPAYYLEKPGHVGLGSGPMTTTGSATVLEVRAVYQAHMAWVGVVFASAIIVILIILANQYMASHVLGPDILGYVSTLTRTNEFIPLPRGGGMLGGLERTRKLADLKVRLQDVAPEAEVGTVALATVDGQRLKSGRKYV